jgi:hypothetical protein
MQGPRIPMQRLGLRLWQTSWWICLQLLLLLQLLQVGMRLGLEVGMRLGLEVGMRLGLEVGMRLGLEVGMRLGLRLLELEWTVQPPQLLPMLLLLLPSSPAEAWEVAWAGAG